MEHSEREREINRDSRGHPESLLMSPKQALNAPAVWPAEIKTKNGERVRTTTLG